MTSHRTGVLACVAALLCIPSLKGQQNPPNTCPAIQHNVATERYQPGQVWTYRTRPHEQGSTFTILAIDSLPKVGTVVHVRVDGLQVRNLRLERVPAIEHMPFTLDAIDRSALSLQKKVPALPTLEGYETWLNACGGVYTITLSEAVEVMEAILNQP